MKLFSMFTGYGGGEWALKKANIPYELIGYSEVDKYAIQCYEKNFPESKGKNFGDCRFINPGSIPDFDLLTGGFPCQDVSIAGNRDLSKGRTMLVNDIFRILAIKKPRYVVLENVKGLLSMRDLFNSIIYTLKELGYGVSYKLLNSKDHGIPQNRERIWIIGKLDGWEFMETPFPYKEELKIFVKDILEKDIPKRYYLSKKQVERIKERNNSFNMKGTRILEDPDVFSGLTCNLSQNDIISHSLFPRTGDPEKGGTGQLSKCDGTVYNLDTSNCQAIEISPTLTCELSHSYGRVFTPEKLTQITGEIRRLTPKECFRLMGFLDDEINLKGLSDTQKYKLAGNGWEINVVSKIFKRMFNGKEDEVSIVY